MIPNIPAFIRDNTRILSPPHVPELRLHLADDAVALWEMTEEQLGELGLPPPFWAFAWAGGQALARYVLDHPHIVRGKRVLDVATGSGLVAIAATRAGAAHALATDIDAFAIESVRLNAELNAVSIDALAADVLDQPTDAEVILVGDLFYDRDISARVAAWLRKLEADGKTVLVGDPGRTYLPKTQMEKLAEYDVAVSRALEDAEVKRTAVWRFTR